VYPHAVALTDEIDWCAFQAAAEYLYTQGLAVVSSYNWGMGKITATRNYVVNRTITLNLHSVVIEGDLAPMSEEQRAYMPGSTIRYNGDDGTLDVPVFIIDSYIYDEFMAAPPGKRNGYPFQGMGNKTIIRDIRFMGKSGDMNGTVGTESGYVSGVRIRKSSFTMIERCEFFGTLWDGLVTTGPQMFLTVRDSWFFNIYRDAIGIRGTNNNFSTTTWIYSNEFGNTGRYAIACDMSYSVLPNPMVWNNDFEHVSTVRSYFQARPEWYVHGVVASCVFIQSGGLTWKENRSENADADGALWGDVHLVSTTAAVLRDSGTVGLVLTAKDPAADKVQALVDYRTAHGFYDFTDVRAWAPAYTGSSYASLAVAGLVLDNCPSIRTIVCGDKISWLTGASTRSTIRSCDLLTLRRVDFIAGTYAKVFPARENAVQWLLDVTPTIESVATYITSATGSHFDVAYDHQTATGKRIIRRAADTFARWVTGTAYVPTSRTGEKSEVIPTLANENGFVYKCTVAGTSGGAEPAWPTTIGGTVADGGVTWTCCATGMGNQNLVPANGLPVDALSGVRTVIGTAIPTLFAAGPWSRGDRVLRLDPVEAGAGGSKYVITGWLCTAAGSGASPVGTWLEMRSLTGN
jgi:hypothetical protein